MNRYYKACWFFKTIFYRLFFGKIGHRSYIGPPVFLSNAKRIFIGDRVRIFPLSRMEVIGSNSKIVVHNNVSAGDGLHLVSMGELIIESDVTISANVMITNLDHSYENYGEHIMNQKNKLSETRVGKNCFIGYGVVILPGTILGDNCIVGANSVIKGCFPDGSVIVGAPGKVVKKYDKQSKEWVKLSIN
jgi:acetyltransferase-like isoleucine patch superfamily enzyme